MRALAAALLLLLAAVAMPARAQGVTPPDRIIAVWGHGEARARPDMARLSAGVVSEAPTARAALDANSAAMTKVIEAVKALEIAASHIRTTGVNLNPVYSRPEGTNAPPHIASYRVNNTVEIRLDDLAKLGTLLDAVTRAGANTANGLSLGIADTDRLEDTAREAAMKDAHRKAALLAKAAGVILGKVASISEEGAGRSPMPMPMRAMAMEAKSVPVEPGESIVEATLRVVYAID